MSSQIERRKREHVELAAGDAMRAAGPAGFDDIHLVHNALPELGPGSVDPSVELLGRHLRLPLVIASMTGGFDGATEINATLAGAAERHGLAMGVGSQRAALVEPQLARTYAVARESAPTAFLIANIGVAQLVAQPDRPALDLSEIQALIDMIRADALAIHLNAVQELVQPEGQPDGAGWEAAIAGMTARLNVPVIAKETGAGISASVARRLAAAGVRAIDVGGQGGTSFAAIEQARAEQEGDRRGTALGVALADWGIPTSVSIVETARAGLPVIGTGGVRSGMDAAKAIALGATAVGVGRPLLQAALDGSLAVDAWVDGFQTALVAAMVLTGSRTTEDLARAPRVITGETQNWLNQLSGGPDV